MPILPRIADNAEALTAIFKDLHANPEIGFEEQRTAAIVAENLRAWGVDEVHTGIAKTGVVGLLRGNGRSADPGGNQAGLRLGQSGPDARLRA